MAAYRKRYDKIYQRAPRATILTILRVWCHAMIYESPVIYLSLSMSQLDKVKLPVILTHAGVIRKSYNKDLSRHKFRG